MALPANDPLTTGGTVALTTYSANWTEIVNTHSVNANGCFQSTAGNGAAIWNADSFPNDQYCQCVLAGAGALNVFIGPAVRTSSTGTLTQYAIRVNQNGQTWQVISFKSNTFQNVSGTTAGTFSAGDTIKIQAIGSTITAFQNGTVLYSFVDGSPIASGSAGFACNGGNSVAEIKTWQAGAAFTPQMASCIYVLP
jgi:hypothetical protein